jgi:hypothetical protein
MTTTKSRQAKPFHVYILTLVRSRKIRTKPSVGQKKRYQVYLTLLGAALLPAAEVEEITFTAFPREFLLADGQVFGHITFGAVVVLLHGETEDQRSNADGDSDHEADLDPLVHLGDFLLQLVCVVLGLHQLLLVSDASLDLFKSLGLHLLLGSQTRDGLGRAALGVSGRHGGDHGASPLSGKTETGGLRKSRKDPW